MSTFTDLFAPNSVDLTSIQDACEFRITKHITMAVGDGRGTILVPAQAQYMAMRYDLPIDEENPYPDGIVLEYDLEPIEWWLLGEDCDLAGPWTQTVLYGEAMTP